MMNKIIRGSEKAVILQGEQFPTSLENYVDIYKKLQLVIKITLFLNHLNISIQAIEKNRISY